MHARTPFRLGLGVQAPAALWRLLRELDQQFATLGLVVRQGDGAALGDALLRGNIDAAVLDDPDALADRVNRWPLYWDRVAVLMPAGHALSAYAEVPAAALSHERLLGRASGCRLGRATDALVIEHRAGEPPRHAGLDDLTVQGMVRAGLGVALCAARGMLPDGLVSRPLAPPAEPFAVVLAVGANEPTAPAADAIIRLARAWDWTT